VILDKLLATLSVEVDPFAVCHIGPGWRLRLPEPPLAMLHFVLRGNGAVSGSSEVPRAVGPSWVAVVPAGSKHALQSDGPIEHERRISPPSDGAPVCQLAGGLPGDASFVVACGLVKVEYGAALNLFEHLQDPLWADLSGVPAVRMAFEGILAEQASLATGSTALTRALMTQCLVHLFRHIASAGSLPWLTALEDPRLGRAIDQILDDPSARHSVESLAETASMSRSAFAERFAAAFGQSPMVLVHHVRMQCAARLLGDEGSLSIDDVAARSGYSSRSHFSAAFSKYHGVPPAEFRASRV
jgi:AraC family transcriptional regulator, activator of mtrCDE